MCIKPVLNNMYRIMKRMMGVRRIRIMNLYDNMVGKKHKHNLLFQLGVVSVVLFWVL